MRLVPSPRRSPSPAPSRPTGVVLAVCCAAQFMVVLDASVVNVALPGMQLALTLGATGQQWVVNAYTVTFAGLLLLAGRAADLFGRRRVFLIGLTLFIVSSLLGGLATNGAWLIAARAAQGAGGAVLAPTSLSLLITSHPDPGRRLRALRVWSATASCAAAIGVVCGGLLTHYLGWRWVLFINVPVGVLLLGASAAVLVGGRPPRQGGRLDVLGAITVTAGLSALVYGIVSTATSQWSSLHTPAALIAGLTLLAAFVLVEARVAEEPLAPLHLFRRRPLVIANCVAVGLGCAQFGMYYFMSLYLQQVKGWSALAAGLAFLPSGLTSLTTSLSLRRLPSHTDPRLQLVCGPLLTVAGLLWLSRLTPEASYPASILGPLVLFGLGMGSTFVPVTALATEGMPSHQAGLASALVNSARQFGGAVGLAAMAAVAGARAPGRFPASTLTAGYDRAFLVPAAASVAGIALTLRLHGRRRRVRAHVPVLVPTRALAPRVVAASGDDGAAHDEMFVGRSTTATRRMHSARTARGAARQEGQP